MVGGGPGAFIGSVHRMAAALDGAYDLVAGAFSSDVARCQETGRALGLESDRTYGSFEEMADAEAGRAEGERIDVVSIVTPNHLHHAVAKAFLQRGIHVICDKPLTTTVADAEDLCRAVAQHGLRFAVTYNYTGYPMVKEARARVRGGELGTLRKVVVEYTQGWLSTPLEAEGQKQAAWRLDPEQAGPSSALGDIGSHAHNLLRYVTGLELARLSADLGSVVPGRQLEDDAAVLLELEGGVRGVLVVSQISVGERNHLRLRIYGSEGGLDWLQEDPEALRLLAPDGSVRTLHRGDPGLSEAARASTRLPAGHPEGFIEAFANVYRSFANSLRASPTSGEPGGAGASTGDAPLDYPTVQDGARGVAFIAKALESSAAGGWVDAAYTPPGATK